MVSLPWFLFLTARITAVMFQVNDDPRDVDVKVQDENCAGRQSVLVSRQDGSAIQNYAGDVAQSRFRQLLIPLWSD